MKFFFLLAICLICGLTLNAQILRYADGNNSWNADSLGNHRAVVVFNGSGSIAHVKINWRRRDKHPETKRIIVQSENSDLVTQVAYNKLTRETGGVLFE